MSKNMNRKVFEEAIALFEIEGKKIQGVYDLLLRGGSAIKGHVYIDNWSDLDLSVIVEQISEKTLDSISDLYQKIKKIFPYKLSITLVTKKDFLNSYHHHGIKPIHYRMNLHNSSISLLQKKIFEISSPPYEMLKVDCFYHIGYLVHDLRLRRISLNRRDLKEMETFLIHLVKRTKHIIRDSIYLLEGYSEEEINKERFIRCFPDLDEDFPDFLKGCRIENVNPGNKRIFIKKCMNKVFHVIDHVYEKVFGEMMDFLVCQKNLRG